MDGTRIPDLPRTSSGNSYICVQRIPYSESHFQSHKPEKIFELAIDICEELLEFVNHTPSVERRHKDQIINALSKLLQKRNNEIINLELQIETLTVQINEATKKEESDKDEAKEQNIWAIRS